MEIAAKLNDAVQRYAHRIVEIARTKEEGHTLQPRQIQAFNRDRDTLEALRPHGARDLVNAFKQDGELLNEAADGRTQRTIRAMQAEAEIRQAPQLRAVRFVQRWQTLERQHTGFDRNGDLQGQHNAKNSMGEMAKSLERDPQVESILRNRTRELGIVLDVGQSVGNTLLQQLGIGRGRGLDL